MKADPKEFKEVAEEFAAVEEDHQALFDSDPELKRLTDRAKSWARIRFEHLASDPPADPTRL